MFFIYTAPKNTTITSQYGFVFKETSGREIIHYRDLIIFVKPRFENCFRPTNTLSPAVFSNSSGLKNNVFEKLRFRDGLVWTVGLTVEILLRFH